MQLESGYSTHRGQVRKTNQDSVGVFQPRWRLFRQHDLPLFIVADGMGGHQGGEVASRVALETVRRAFRAASRTAPPNQALRTSIQAANEAVVNKADNSPALSGMGTTIVAATISDGRLYVGNVGDSRAYLIRDHAIRRITNDHSFVEEQVRAGVLTEDQAVGAVGRNILTRAIGRRGGIPVDIFEESWLPGDRLVLCSDGLWGVVSPDEIMAIALEQPPQEAAKQLVDAAIANHSTDNISIVIVRCV
ncbi:MAG: hypothetical protein Kow00124_15080 [Anaerolineae bacterium]